MVARMPPRLHEDELLVARDGEQGDGDVPRFTDWLVGKIIKNNHQDHNYHHISDCSEYLDRLI